MYTVYDWNIVNWDVRQRSRQIDLSVICCLPSDIDIVADTDPYLVSFVLKHNYQFGIIID